MMPKIIIPQNIRNKIQFIVDQCPMEVSGLGTVIFDPKQNAYIVTDTILLKQEVGACHTDLDDDAVAHACFEMRNCLGDLVFWWHSHVNMGTGWSATDHKTMELIGKNGLCVAVVFNKKEEMRGAIVMSPENYPKIKLDNVDIEIQYDYDFNPEDLLKEISEKVKPKVYNSGTTLTTNVTSNVNYSDSVGLGGQGLTNYEKSRDLALKAWNKLGKSERKRYAGFEDYMEEFLWGETILGYEYRM